MLYKHETIQFKLTLGIYRQARHTLRTGYHVFSTTNCHETTFEIDCDHLPLNSSEIPHRLLIEAQAKAELLASEFKTEGDSEWWDTLPILPNGRWDNEPLWHTPDIFECFKYYHEAFRSVHFLKLEWQDWRKGGSA